MLECHDCDPAGESLRLNGLYIKRWARYSTTVSFSCILKHSSGLALMLHFTLLLILFVHSVVKMIIIPVMLVHVVCVYLHELKGIL